MKKPLDNFTVKDTRISDISASIYKENNNYI